MAEVYYKSFSKIDGYSLTDLHDFKECTFRFFVRHHLDKKYQIAKGSSQMALGVILDQSIKNIHKAKAYGHPLEKLINVVSYSAKKLKEDEAKNPKKPNFNTAVVEFLTDDLITSAENVFRNYYQQIEGKFQKMVVEVGFCKWFSEIDGEEYIFWGGPDTVEMGDDGIPEIIDYKSRQDIGYGKQNMDMNLMPKMYTLLMSKELKKMGFKKARFMVKFWQDAKDRSFSLDFDLDNLKEDEELFKDIIRKIVKSKEFSFCGNKYCDACNHSDREKFAEELKEKFGLNYVQ